MVPPSRVVLARATEDTLGGGTPPPETLRNDTAAVIGIAFAVALVLGCGIWLTFYFFRRRRKARREQAVQEEDRKRIARKSILIRAEEKAAMLVSPTPRPMDTSKARAVDRALVTASVVMPEKALTPRVGHQRQTIDLAVNTVQNPPLPPPIMLQPPSPDVEDAAHRVGTQRSSPSIQEIPRSAQSRPGSSSRPVSFVSRSSPLRHSASATPSRASSYSASASAPVFEEGQMRRVRQVFMRALPDELVVAHGEHLAIVRQYDDGWCVVGRESRGRPGDVEFGAVPVWVFARPEEGVRPMRPTRNASLNVRLSLEAPGGPSFAWTNT
ncbi:hypothetical protein DAEQUDRAFT_762091 [Daedalea quercina L-15889]|uniref:SH3 domain-containing protein n=1 Tax=Daedalea quercina L-15889 TaxID=1314783 RepID=A0A165TM74_9APHY|nr:hypothetical protein DAEQUDRAFT_762091 [Daedalea quercina L-15889]